MSTRGSPRESIFKPDSLGRSTPVRYYQIWTYALHPYMAVKAVKAVSGNRLWLYVALLRKP